MNPVAFILIALVLISLMLAIIFLMAWRNFGRQKHALTWAATFMAGSLQWTVNLFSRDLFADRRWYWIVANALALLVLSQALAGYRQRAGLRTRGAMLAAGAVSALALIVWFTFVQPHVGIQQAVILFYAPIMLVASAWVLLRQSRHVLAAEKGAAAVMVLFSLSQMAAGIAALMQGAERDAYWESVYLMINFVTLPSAYTGLGLFAVFILATDLSEQMKQLARVDQLTQLLNRRGFAELAALALSRIRGSGAPMAVVLGDIDHFKAINDRFGHHAGDQVLRGFASLLKAMLGKDDLAARIGGEEFVMVFPGRTAEHAVMKVEQLREQFKTQELKMGEQTITPTASFGIAELNAGDASIYDVIKRADEAMYQAKHEGRNRLVLADSELSIPDAMNHGSSE